MIDIAQSIVSSKMPYSYLVNLAHCPGPMTSPRPHIGLLAVGGLMMVIGVVMFFKAARKREYTRWISLFVFGGVLLGLSFVFATPGKPIPRAVQCSVNLNVICKACYMYMGDFDGKMPPNLEILMETHDLIPCLFVCPASGDEEGDNSYIYRGADLNDNCLSEMVIAYDKKENHRGIVRNVLFVDSHVKKYTEEEFQGVMKRDNEIRREMGLPEKEVGFE